MFFQAIYTLKMHLNIVSNAKTNNIEEKEVFMLIFAYITRQDKQGGRR
jgi:hypothetical protein